MAQLEYKAKIFGIVTLRQHPKSLVKLNKVSFLFESINQFQVFYLSLQLYEYAILQFLCHMNFYSYLFVFVLAINSFHYVRIRAITNLLNLSESCYVCLLLHFNEAIPKLFEVLSHKLFVITFYNCILLYLGFIDLSFIFPNQINYAITIIIEFIIIQRQMKIEVSEVLDAYQGPKNQTQNKIIKLIQQLKRQQPQLSKGKQSEQNAFKIKLFKQNMMSKLGLVDQKVNTAILMLNQVQNQINQIWNTKKRFRMFINHNENVEQIQRQQKQFHKLQQKQLSNLQKLYKQKVLEIKMANVENQQKSRFQLNQDKEEAYCLQLNRIKRNIQETTQIRQQQLVKKVKLLKKGIEQNSLRHSEQIKNIKNKFLFICEEISKDIKKQHQLLQQNFERHCQTLQKMTCTIQNTIMQ